MCGRYVLKTSTPELAALLGVDDDVWSSVDTGFVDGATGEVIDLSSFNVAPTQAITACRLSEQGTRELARMRWGLVPSWSKDMKASARMINARSETVRERPAFRAAYKRRRCLVPGDGFFEWKRIGKTRQPYYFTRRDGEPLVFAGLWEIWHDPDGQRIDSCTVLTTQANAVVADVHDRMPVILENEALESWLHAAPDTGGPMPSLEAEKMQAVPVSTFVNNARNNQPRCIERLDADGFAQASADGPADKSGDGSSSREPDTP